MVTIVLAPKEEAWLGADPSASTKRLLVNYETAAWASSKHCAGSNHGVELLGVEVITAEIGVVRGAANEMPVDSPTVKAHESMTVPYM